MHLALPLSAELFHPNGCSTLPPRLKLEGRPAMTRIAVLLLLALAHSACAPVPRERPMAFNPWLYEIWPKYQPLTDAQIQELNRPRPAWAQPPIDTPGKWLMRPWTAPSTTVNVHVHVPGPTETTPGTQGPATR
jgi:hypothetical protein